MKNAYGGHELWCTTFFVYYELGTVCECNMKVDVATKTFNKDFWLRSRVWSILICLLLTDCDSIVEIKLGLCDSFLLKYILFVHSIYREVLLRLAWQTKWNFRNISSTCISWILHFHAQGISYIDRDRMARSGWETRLNAYNEMSFENFIYPTELRISFNF